MSVDPARIPPIASTPHPALPFTVRLSTVLTVVGCNACGWTSSVQCHDDTVEPSPRAQVIALIEGHTCP